MLITGLKGMPSLIFLMLMKGHSQFEFYQACRSVLLLRSPNTWLGLFSPALHGVQRPANRSWGRAALVAIFFVLINYAWVSCPLAGMLTSIILHARTKNFLLLRIAHFDVIAGCCTFSTVAELSGTQCHFHILRSLALWLLVWAIVADCSFLATAHAALLSVCPLCAFT